MYFPFLIIIVLILGVLSIEKVTVYKSYVEQDPLFRLPKSILPINYDLTLRINLENNTFSGQVIINANVIDLLTNSISLNYKNIHVNWEGAIITQNNVKKKILFVDYSRKEEEICQLDFEEDFLLDTLKIQLEFTGDIRSDFKGLYKHNYAEEKFIIATQFKTTFARMVFPCFDEPHFKAKFKVKIFHPEEYNVLSNMPQHEKNVPQMENNNLVSTTFDETVAMSTYLLTLFVSDFVSKNISDNLLSIYSTANTVDATISSTEYASKALEALEILLESNYTLPKLDFVAIPNFKKNSIEFWGLINIDSRYLLYKNINTPSEIHQRGQLLITHELAHIWFGNSVTPEWWDYLWLSEGFSTYFEYLITDYLQPKWRIMDQFSVNNLQSALGFDDSLNVCGMTSYVSMPDEINDLFDFVVYGKTASIIRMFEHSFGKELFITAIKNYIKSRNLTTTNPKYLFQNLQTEIDNQKIELPTTVERIFESWSNSPGYPVVNANVDDKLKTITFSQKRFFVKPSFEEFNNNPSYFIPINIAFSIESNFNQTSTDIWLKPEETEYKYEFNTKFNWFILNKQQTGYYRVNYNKDNWLALIKELRNNSFNKIHFLNRAQLIDDASNFARISLLSYDIVFELLMYLKQETDFIPWITTKNVMSHLIRILRGSTQYGRFENFIRNITYNNYNNYTIHMKLNGHVERLHRVNVLGLACIFGIPSCVKEAYEALELDRFPEGLSEELQPIVYCTTIKYAKDEKIGEKLLNSMGELLFMGREKNLEKIYRIITGLGCSRNPDVIEKMLSLATEEFNEPGIPKIYEDDRKHIFVSLLTGSYIGTKLGLEFLLEKYVTVERFLGSDRMEEIFKIVGPYIVTAELNNLLKNIIIEYTINFTPGVADAVLEATKFGQENIDWLKTFTPVIDKWLIENIEELPSNSSRTLSFNTIIILIITGILRYIF